MLQARDSAVLRHIGRHRMTLRAVLSRLFFGGRSPGNVLQRLSEGGYIARRSVKDGPETTSLPDGVSYYQLTTKAAAALGFPASRCRRLEPARLHTALGVLWFTCMGKKRRDLLEPEQLGGLFGAPSGSASTHPICRDLSGSRPVLYEVYVPAPQTRVRNVVRRVEGRWETAHEDGVLRPWVEARSYCFAILVDNRGRAKRIKNQIGCRGLQSKTRFTVAHAPSPATLRAAIASLEPLENEVTP